MLDDIDTQRAFVLKAKKMLSGTAREGQNFLERHKMLQDFNPKMLVRVMQVHPNSL